MRGGSQNQIDYLFEVDESMELAAEDIKSDTQHAWTCKRSPFSTPPIQLTSLPTCTFISCTQSYCRLQSQLRIDRHLHPCIHVFVADQSCSGISSKVRCNHTLAISLSADILAFASLDGRLTQFSTAMDNVAQELRSN